MIEVRSVCTYSTLFFNFALNFGSIFGDNLSLSPNEASIIDSCLVALRSDRNPVPEDGLLRWCAPLTISFTSLRALWTFVSGDCPRILASRTYVVSAC